MKCALRRFWFRMGKSLPVRGAWIEIICLGKLIAAMLVAPRAGSVD